MSTPAVPTGWSIAALKELISPNGFLSDGDWVETKDQDPAGEVRLTQLADVGDGVWRNRSRRFLTRETSVALRCTHLQAGDVLVARMPDPLGRACVFPGDPRPCVTAVDVCIIRTGSDISQRWLAHFINAPSFREAISAVQSGSTRKRISRTNLAALKLPVPPSEEQRRIAIAIDDHLSRLDDVIRSLERAKCKLQKYRAALLTAAIEGRLVPTEAELSRAEGRDYEPASVLLQRVLAQRQARWPTDRKYRAPSEVRLGQTPPLPEGWCWATLDCLISGIDAGKNFRCLERPPAANEVGVVKVSSVTWGTFDELESKTCTRIDFIDPDHFIGAGDLLISRANTIALVGACVIVERAPTRTLMLSDKILRLKALPNWAPWILWALRSAWGRSEIQRLATGNQESMRNISQESVRAIRVPVPPAAERDRIVDGIGLAMTSANAVERTLSAQSLRTMRLRQSVLNWAFEGKLVEQDANDEPASVLLERIKAERPAAMARVKTGRTRRSMLAKTKPAKTA